MIEIRHTKIEEFGDWKELWHGYLRFLDYELPLAITELTWQRFHDDGEMLFCFAAYEGPRMLGFATYLLHRSTWATHHYCYLEDLFVDPASRGKGVGRKLIDAVRAEAIENNCGRYYWVTLENNHAAQRIYDELADRSDVIQYRMKL